MKIKIIIVFFLLFPSLAYSAGKTWTFNGAGLWSTGANWDPAGAPGTDSEVVIDKAGISVLYDGGDPVSTLTIGSTQLCTLFMGNSTSIYITNNFTIDPNGFVGGIGGNGTIIIQGNFNCNNPNAFIPIDYPPYLTFANTSSTASIPGINMANWCLQIDSASKAEMAGNITCGYFEIASNAVFFQNSYNLNCSKNFTVSSTGVFSKGTGKVIFDGGILQALSVSSTSDIGNVEIAQSATGTTVNCATKVNLTSLVIGTSCEFKNTTAGATVSMSIDSTGITVFGKLTLKDCYLIKTSGDFAMTIDGGTVGLTVVNIKNCSPVNITVDATNGCADLGGNSPNIIFVPQLTGKTWVGGTGVWDVGDNWNDSYAPDENSDVYITSGVVNNAKGAIGNLTLSNCSLTLTGDLTVSHFLTVGSGVTINSGSSNLLVRKNIYAWNSLIAGSGNFKLAGGISQSIFLNAPSWNLHNVNTSGYTVSSSGAVTCANFTLNSNSKFQSNYDLSCINLTVGAIGDLTCGANLEIKGSATIPAGTFSVSDNNTVFFNSGGLQIADISGIFRGIKVKTSGTLVSLVNGIYCYSLDIDAGTTVKNCIAGKSMTIIDSLVLNGSLILKGSSWNLGDIELTRGGSNVFKFEKNPGSSITWEYVGLSNCSAVSYLNVSDLLVNNLGYNRNFKFPPRSWLGGNSSWGDQNKWYPPYSPRGLDDVIINTGGNITGVSSTASNDIGSITVSGSSGVTLQIDAIGIIGNIKMPSGSVLTNVPGRGWLDVYGDVEVLGDVSGSGFLHLHGAANQNVKWPASTWSISISPSSGNVTAIWQNTGTLSCKSITVDSNGNFNVGNNNLELSGNLIIDGALIGTVGNLSFDSKKTSAELYSFKDNNSSFTDIKINSVNTTVSLISNLKFSSLNIISSAQFIGTAIGTTITVDSSNSITVADYGKLLLSGISGNLIKLQSNSTGNQFYLNRGSNSIVQMAYVDIIDCNANVQVVYVSPTCITTNTTNILISGSDYSKTWTWSGTGAGNWNTPANWNPTGVPSFIYDVIVPSGTGNIIYNATVSPIASLSFAGNGILSLGNYTLTVNGNFSTGAGYTLYGVSAGGVIIANGPVSIGGPTGGTATLQYNGNSVKSINWAGDTNWSITIANSSLATLSNAFSCRNLRIASSGILSQGSYNLTVYGGIRIDDIGNCTLGNGHTAISGAGGLTATGTLTQTGAGILSVPGSFLVNASGRFVQSQATTYLGNSCILNNTGVSSFVKGSGKLVFNGTDQTLKITNSDDIGNLQVTNNSTVLLTTNIHFTNLTVDAGSFFIDSKAGTTLTITNGGGITANGTLTIAGNDVNTLTILTSDSETPFASKFSLKTDASNTILSYVGIRNCTPVSGQLDALNNCTNLEGNDTAHIYFTASGATWTGGASNNNWTSAGNWSGGAVPDAVSDVVINIPSTVITKVSGVIHALTLSGTSSLTLSGGLTVNSSFNAADSITVNTGTNILAVRGNINAPLIIGTGNLKILNSSSPISLAFNAPNWNIQNSNASYTVNMASSLTCVNLTLDSSTGLSARSYDLCIKGTADLNGIFYKGTGTMSFNSGSLQPLYLSSGNASHLGNVRLNNSNTTLSWTGNARFSNLFIDSGTNFKNTTAGATITIDSYGSVTVNSTGTLTLVGSSWGVSSVVWQSSGTARFTLDPSGTLSLTYVSLTGCNAGGVALDLSSKTVNNLGNNININFPSRTWISGVTDSWTAVSRWYPPAAPDALDNVIINVASSTVTGASGSINSLVIGGSSANLSGGTLNILGSAPSGVSILSSGTANNVILNVKGNAFSNNSASVIGSLTLNGNSVQTLRWSGSIKNNLTISNSGATVTLANADAETLFVNNITVNSYAALQLSSKTIRITGDASFNGTLISNSTATLFFNKDSGLQNLTAANNTLGNVIARSGAGTTTLNLVNSAKIFNLIIEADTQFQSLADGTTISVSPSSAGITVKAGGAFLLAGSCDNYSFLKSLTSGQTFKFYRAADETAVAKFTYVDISDCNAGSGTAVYVHPNCLTENRNNTNIIETAGINNKMWVGADGGAWNDANNWDPSEIPTAVDDVFIAGVINQPSGALVVSSLIFTAPSALTFSSLTVKGNCTVADNSILNSGNLYVKGNLIGHDIAGIGSLHLTGRLSQAIDWQGGNWSINSANISSEGVSAVAEVRCSSFSVSNNTKYHHGSGNLVVLGNMTVNTGGRFTQSSTSDLSVGGILNLNSGSYSSFGGNLSVGPFNCSYGTCALGTGNANINADCLISYSSSFNQNLSSLNIAGYLEIRNGAVYTQLTKDLYIAGNFSSLGYFNQGSSITNFSGSSFFVTASKFNRGSGTLRFLKGDLQILTANNNNLGKVEVVNSNTILSLANSAEFTSLTINSGASLVCSSNDKVIKTGSAVVNGTLNFSASRLTVLVYPKPDSGITVNSSGKLNIIGNANDGTKNYISFLSNQQGTQFNLTANSTDNVSLRYSNIRDCDASSGNYVGAEYCIDLGNNANVIFGAQPPATINDLKLRQSAGSREVKCEWTAVGVEGRIGKASSYIVKYSAVNITTQEQFDASFTYSQNWNLLKSGETERFTLTGLPQGADIWFVSVEAKNFAGLAGNVSQISEFVVQIDPERPVSYSLPGERGNVNIEIPAGTFTRNVEITGKELSGTQMPAVASQQEFKATGLGASFSIFPVEKFKQPLKLKIKYEDKDIEGLKAEKLKIAFYNDTMGKWYHLKSKSDPVQKSVSADLKHLTTFRVVEYTYLGLHTVKVFPNPWKVGTGGSFDNGELIFKNLPEKGRIRIYNVAGEMVKDISITESDGGFYSWNGTNDAGNKISSGVYLAYVEDNEGNHRIVKIALIR